MRHNVSSWTMFGSKAWTHDLPYDRRLLFMEMLKEYERQGVEPPYSSIRKDVLLLPHEQIKIRIEELKSKVRKSIPIIDSLMVDEAGNDEE